MDFRKANQTEHSAVIKIARSLSDWFSAEAVRNMQTDFAHNKLIVALSNEEIVGFLCYTTYSGKCLLLWMGVKPDKHYQGIGAKLIGFLEQIAREHSLHTIEIETLSNTNNYEPYQNTCDFYYRQGFVSILQKPATIDGFDDMMILEKKL